MTTGIYDADGNIRTTTVDGSDYTGLYAADGSFNVVLDDTTYTGLHHPSGALRVNSGSSTTTYDASGAFYMTPALHRNGVSVNTVLTAHVESTTDATSYTFSAVDLGIPSADRLIVVGISLRNSTAPLVSSLTINGVTATKIDGMTVTTGTRAEVWYANVPTGTSGDIVVSLSSQSLRCGIGVWSVTGNPKLWSVMDCSTNPMTNKLHVPSGGSVIAYGLGIDNTTLRTVSSWTKVTEDFDATIETTVRHTGASANFPNGGSVTPVGTWSATPNLGSISFFLVFGSQSIFNFPFVERISGIGATQGAAFDGTYIYTTPGQGDADLNQQWILSKYDLAGNLITSRNTGTDGDGLHHQLCNIYYDKTTDKLYVAANDFTSAEGYPQTDPNGWVLIYNASDLSFDSYHKLPGRITESIVPWNGYWWEVGWDTHQIRQLDDTFTLINTFDLPGPNPGGHGYWQANFVIDDIFYLNPHEDTGTIQFMEAYKWNGAGFDLIQTNLAMPTDKCTQSAYFDGVNVWWAERVGLTDGNVVKSTVIKAR